MRINRENYEEFLVDYAEGTLSAQMMQEVKTFLLLNPDVQEEFDLFNDAMVETVNVSFEAKENLKKIPFEKTTASSDYFQQLCVAHIEGVIPDNDESFLQDLVARDKTKQQELDLFEKTKLKVDAFNFNEKLTLKKDDILHQIDHVNFGEYCIASMEGWLDQKGLVALNDFIAENPLMKHELDAYYATRVQPDLSIVYPDKRKIKRFNILSPTIKKYGSLIASAAAILVLAFMVYYTTTVDDTAQMASSVVSNVIDNSQVESVPENLVVDSNLETDERIKLLHDPFGFEKLKISSEGSKEVVNSSDRVAVSRVEPIKLNEIDCPPCKQVFENRTLITSKNSVYKKPKTENLLADNSTVKSAKKPSNHVLGIAQSGLEGLGKITNTEIKVQKNKKGEKTRIAFNSKYFSFSTNVNKKK